MELRHYKVLHRAQQMLQLVRRRRTVKLNTIGDQAARVHDLGAVCVSREVRLIALLRRDAALYAPSPPRLHGTNGYPSVKGEQPDEVMQAFVKRWPIETICDECPDSGSFAL